MAANRIVLALVVVTAVAVGGAAGRRPAAVQEAGTQPLVGVAVDALPAVPAGIELARITLEPGAGRELVVPGPEIYAVEQGTPGLRVDGPALLTRSLPDGGVAAPEALEVGVDHTLVAGDQVVILAYVPHVLFNDGSEPAALLNTVIFPASALLPSWLPDVTLPPGVGIAPLATDVIDAPGALPTGPAELVLARVVADPASDLTPDVFGPAWPAEQAEAANPDGAAPASDPTERFVLLVVEEGLLTVVMDGGAETEYRPGEVIRFAPGESASLRNGGAGAVVALALTIEPGESATEGQG